jgi:hypothetical protein
MKKIFFIILFSSLLFANIGTITSIKGEVIIKRDFNTIPATVGMSLKEKDTILTQKDSRALLLFKDNTTIAVGKNSSFSIDEYLFDDKNSKVSFRFGNGIYRTVTGLIGKINPKRFKILTPTASIGIRGSDGTTIITPNGTVKHTTHSGGFVLTDLTTQRTVFIPKDHTGIRTNKVVDVRINTQKDIEATKEISSIKIKKTKPTLLIQPTNTTTEDSTKIKVSNNIDKISISQLQNSTSILDETTLAVDTTNKVTQLPTKSSNEVFNLTPAGNNLNIENLVIINKAKQTTNNYTNNSADSYLEYGYWATHTTDITKRTDTYLNGITSTNDMVDDYVNREVTASYYSGNIASFVTTTAGTTNSSDGTINLNINFDNQSFKGAINIVQDNWKAVIKSGTLSKNIDTNKYQISSTDLTSGTSSSVKDITGSVNGKFFGANLDSIGGKFQLNSTSNGTVNGVFGAKK